jgi:carbamoyl-phosphate synthase large subunit
MINVLLTCAGRRNYLIDYFRKALSGRGEILAADAITSAPALQEADRAFKVPPVTHPEYIDVLLEICRGHRVRMLLSLNDLELPLLARQRERFLAVGTFPVVSSADVVDLCFDKWATREFLSRIGVSTPKTYLTFEEVKRAMEQGEIRLPLAIKPRWGTASIGIEYPESLEELEMAWRLSQLRLMRTILSGPSASDRERCLLAQERLSGSEFGLDVVNDLQGRYVGTFIRCKLSMRAGETDQAVTVFHPQLERLGRQIGEALGHIGNLDCDVFVDGGKCQVLEMNPRFGGGYPFSHSAGANLPAALLAWAEGKIPDPKWLTLKAGVASAKCDRLVEINHHTQAQSMSLGNQNTVSQEKPFNTAG